MGVKIEGEKALLAELDRRYGPAATQRMSDRALLAGAAVFKEVLEREFETFADTGASKDEITIGKPTTSGGVRMVPIHWRGPKNRYAVIHLNEFGTVKNPNPRGKGAIARAMRNAERAYRETIKREIAKGAR